VNPVIADLALRSLDDGIHHHREDDGPDQGDGDADGGWSAAMDSPSTTTAASITSPGANPAGSRQADDHRHHREQSEDARNPHAPNVCRRAHDRNFIRTSRRAAHDLPTVLDARARDWSVAYAETWVRGSVNRIRDPLIDSYQ
jgi:hypothetical protein